MTSYFLIKRLASKQRVGSSSLSGIATSKPAVVLGFRPKQHLKNHRIELYGISSNCRFLYRVFGENSGRLLGITTYKSRAVCPGCGLIICACTGPFKGAA